jgi:K+-transporting ATPase A subunit
MATFLRVIAFIYLAAIWLTFFTAVSIATSTNPNPLLSTLFFLIAILLSVPAAILYAFGQLVSYARRTAEHLAVMRSLFEQRGPAALRAIVDQIEREPKEVWK